MGFILKKSRVAVIPLGNHEDGIIVKCKKIKNEVLFPLLQEMMEAAQEVVEQKDGAMGKQLEALNAVRDILLPAITEWKNVGDKKFEPVDRDLLRDIIDEDMKMLSDLAAGINILAGTTKKVDDAEKNLQSTSQSAETAH